MTKANDLASLLDANGDVVSSALDNVPAAPTPSLSSLGIPNHDDITVDASGNVKIGTATDSWSGSNTLVIKEDSGDGGITLVSSSTSNNMNIGFADTQTSSFADMRGLITYLHANDAMRFMTANTEAARLDASGNLLVGKAASNVATEGAEIRSSGFTGLTVDGGAGLTIRRLTSDGELQSFFKDTTKVGSISAYAGSIIAGSGDTGIFFYDAGDVLRPVSPTTLSTRDNTIDIGSSAARFKGLNLTGGVYLGGTSSAHLLDDYEEGTFNVVLGGSSSTSGQSYGNQTGRYTKIGSLVHCSGYITVSSIGTVTGTYAQLQNLPFTVGSAAPYGNGNYSGGVFSYWNNFNVNSAGFTLYPDTGATFAYVMYRGSFSTSVDYMSPSGWGSNPAIMFSLTYTTDA